jgi:hypothetical protein
LAHRKGLLDSAGDWAVSPYSYAQCSAMISARLSSADPVTLMHTLAAAYIFDLKEKIIAVQKMTIL